MGLDTTEEGQKPCTAPCAGVALWTKQTHMAGLIFDRLGLLVEAARVVDAAPLEAVAIRKRLDFASVSIKLPASPLKCGLGGCVYPKEHVVRAPDPSYVPILDIKERRRWAAAEWNAANPEPSRSRPPRSRHPKSDEASRKRAARIANDSEEARAKEVERKRVEGGEEKKNDRTVKFDECGVPQLCKSVDVDGPMEEARKHILETAKKNVRVS